MRMKKGKKALCMLLSGVMACSVASAAFIASAAEEKKPVFPSEKVAEQTEGLITMAGGLVDGLIQPDTFYSNQSIANLIGTINTLVESVIHESIAPKEYYLFAYAGQEVNPLEPYKDATTWDGIDMAAIDFGVTAGDADSFFSVVKLILRPVGTVLPLVMGDDLTQPAPTEPTLDPATGINSPMYRFTLYPILEVLGLDVATPDEWRELTTQVVMAQAGLTAITDVIEQAQADIINFEEYDYGFYFESLEEAQQALVDALAALDAANATIAEKYNAATAAIVNPIVDLVQELLADPVNGLLSKLPVINDLLAGGDLDFLFTMLVPGLTADSMPRNIPGLLNFVCSMDLSALLPDAGITTLGLYFDPALFPYTNEEFAAMTNPERLYAFAVYAVTALQNPEFDNITPLKGLLNKVLAGTDYVDMIDIIIPVLTDNEPAVVVETLLDLVVPYEAPTTEPTTSADDTTVAGGDDTTTAVDDSTTTTNAPTTAPGTDKNPDMGDVALSAVAVVTLAAGAAFVMLRKRVK